MDDAAGNWEDDFDAAERHISRREFRSAVKLLESVTKAETKHGVAWRLLGDCLRELGKYEPAEDAYNAALALRPADPEVYFGRGAAAMKSQKWREAIRNFSHALKLNPQYADAALEIGLAWSHRWLRHRRAAHCFRLAIRLAPNWDDPRFFLGLDYYQTGDWQRRSYALRKVLQVAPDWAEGHYIVGVIAMNGGNLRDDDAAQSFQNAVRLRPDWVKGWLALGQAHSDLEEWEAAADAYKQARELDPANAEGSLGLGAAYQALEQWRDALDAYLTAQANAPNLPETAYHLGEVYNELGLPSEAAQSFRRALELRPGLAEAHYGLGAACFRNGDTDGAKEQIDILLQLDQELAQELYSRCFLTEDA